MDFDPAAWQSLFVAVIAATAGYATQRTISKSTETNARMDAESKAYERARSFDTETITRQNTEIAEIRTENMALKTQLKEALDRISILERSMAKYEQEGTPA